MRRAVSLVLVSVIVLVSGTMSAIAQTSEPTSDVEMPEHAEQMWMRIFLPEDLLSGEESSGSFIAVAWEFDTEKHAEELVEEMEAGGGDFDQSSRKIEELTDEVVLKERTADDGEPTAAILIRDDEFVHVWGATGFGDPSEVLLEMYEHHFGDDREETDVLPTEDEVPDGLEQFSDYHERS